MRQIIILILLSMSMAHANQEESYNYADLRWSDDFSVVSEKLYRQGFLRSCGKGLIEENFNLAMCKTRDKCWSCVFRKQGLSLRGLYSEKKLASVYIEIENDTEARSVNAAFRQLVDKYGNPKYKFNKNPLAINEPSDLLPGILKPDPYYLWTSKTRNSITFNGRQIVYRDTLSTSWLIDQINKNDIDNSLF